MQRRSGYVMDSQGATSAMRLDLRASIARRHVTMSIIIMAIIIAAVIAATCRLGQSMADAAAAHAMAAI